MLRVNRHLTDSGSAVFSEAEEALQLFIQTLRRRKWIILSSALIGAGLAAGYCALSTPLYTAEALLLIDSKQARALSVSALGAEIMDSSMVDSQVEILKSERIAKSVISYLDQVRDHGGATSSGPAPTIGASAAAAAQPSVVPVAGAQAAARDAESGTAAPRALAQAPSSADSDLRVQDPPASVAPGSTSSPGLVPSAPDAAGARGSAGTEPVAVSDKSSGTPTASPGWSWRNVLYFAFPFLFDASEPSQYERDRSRINTFVKRLKVQRLSRSYAISIGFTSPDPMLAALTANQVAEAYIVDQLESKFQATRRASVWLQDRITELRDQALAADRAVQDFKAKNNIIDTTRGLVSEQQLADVNSRLIQARAQTAEALARFERIREILRENNARGISEEVVSDVLNSGIISGLRTKFLEAEKRYAEWSKRYGNDHLAVLNLRSEMQGIQRALFNELGRIAETYKSEVEISRAREASISKDFDKLISQTKISNQAQVELRELESAAQSYRGLYDNFLQRYMQATQEQSFPITEARLITDASEPLRPSAPRTKLIVAAGLMGGLIFGIGFGLMRERMSRTFRLPADVDHYLGLESLGALQRFPAAADTITTGRSAFEDTAGPFRWAVSDPFARYAEVMRAVKVSADVSLLDRASKVIGITSTLPKEGKSTISANLAQLIAHSGANCILVDADLRNPSLTRRIAPAAKQGLLELVLGTATLEEVVVFDPLTKLRFIPSPVPGDLVHSNDVLASVAMGRLMQELRKEAAYVIVDMPPLAPVVDVLASAHLFDCFVYVLEWASVKRNLVTDTLRKNPEVYKKILGCLLNKVDLGTLRSLEDYGKSYYYYKYQASYGRRA